MDVYQRVLLLLHWNASIVSKKETSLLGVSVLLTLFNA